MTKSCNKCGEIKVAADFYSNKSDITKLSTYCKECNREKCRNWKKNNKEKVSSYNKKWAKEHRVDRNKYRTELDRNRRKTDILFKLKEKIRTITKRAFRKIGTRKSSITEKLLGCTPLELKSYLESLFKPGMSWENRSKWHIDHIIPLASAKTEEDVIKLCHYTNLQPLWAHDNFVKGSKIMVDNDKHTN